MRRTLLSSALIAIALAAGSTAETSAQESYSYTVTRTQTRTLRIDWRPEQKTHQRYTVAVNPPRLLSSGLRFDFEREMPRPGHWIGTSLSVYFAPALGGSNSGLYNDRWSLLSSFDSYHRMWGVGTSATYKYIFSRRGWYFATGLMFDFFRVGVATDAFVPYREDGMTYYEYGRALETESYFKPTARFVMGKHMAVSRRCFFDLYGGMGLSYSIYRDGDRHYGYGYDYDPHFDDMGGFAYRGLTLVGGFRFGVLLWKDLQ
ncbi:MAG: hypothetical protein LBU98_03670 [Alistipes sp.]|jgi:hypothetical protein|nr:hypothetical protein [Alistipes sp.]